MTTKKKTTTKKAAPKKAAPPQIEIRCSHTRLVPIDEIKEHPDNPNQHPDSQIILLMDIIRRTGWRQALVVSNGSGFVIKGHGRLQAARALGMTHLPVDYQDYASEAYELADMVADNEIAALSTRSTSKLADIEKALNESTDADARLAGIASALDDKIDPNDTEALRQQRLAEKIAAKANLAESFGTVPFSILRADDSRWRARKSLYKKLGIRSEEGRKSGLAYATSAAMPPNLIQAKNDYDEAKGGEPSTIDEFMAEHGHETLATTSIFDPVLCELMYRWFLPTPTDDQGPGKARPFRILDPFAGGSVRGVVAALHGHEYIGIDLRTEQIDANYANAKEIFDAVGAPDHQPHWISGNSLHTDQLLTDNDQAQPFDLIFTCPPYGDLEVYSENPEDISTMDEADFTTDYKKITEAAAKHLAANRFAVYVVGDYRDRRSGRLIDLLGKTVQAHQEAELTYYNHFILQTPVASLIMRLRNQFNTSRKIGKRHQNVIISHNGPKADNLLIEHIAETVTAEDFNFTKAAPSSHSNVIISMSSKTDDGIKDEFNDLDISGDTDTIEELMADQEENKA